VTVQPYHHGSLRATLLARAATVLAKAGADGLSLRRLARDVGVSHAAPTRHFKDRQALLDALAFDGFAEMNRRMEEAAATPGSIREKVRAVAHAYVRFSVDNSALQAVMYSSKHHPAASRDLQEVAGQSLLVTTRLIAQGQAAGDISPGDPDRLAMVAFASTHGIAVLGIGDLLNGLPVEDAVESVLDVLWSGLGTT
jgi:AcrR family transcriptional regulator